MDGSSKNFELNSGACMTDLESFRRLKNGDIDISVGTKDVNDQGMTEEADGSRRCADVRILVSMDETNPVAENPLCSPGEFNEKVAKCLSSELSAKVAFTGSEWSSSEDDWECPNYSSSSNVDEPSNEIRTDSGFNKNHLEKDQCPQFSAPTPVPASSLPSGPQCARCYWPVETGICTVDRFYHPECFRCSVCGRRIKLPKYAISDGKLYCVKHFKKMLALRKPNEEKPDQRSGSFLDLPARFPTMSPTQQPKARVNNPVYCASCGMQLQESVYKGGKHYHPDCVDCVMCNRTAGTDRFVVHQNQIYCSEHAERRYMEKPTKQIEEPVKVAKRSDSCRRSKRKKVVQTVGCAVCYNTIEGGLLVDGKYYHSWCFKCFKCNKKLRLGEYQDLGGMRVCTRKLCRAGAVPDRDTVDEAIQEIYMEQQRPVRPNLLQNVSLTVPCAVCDLPTSEGYCIFGKVYHPTCFKCADCGMKLTLKKCRIIRDSFYCPRDCKKITGTSRIFEAVSSNGMKNVCYVRMFNCNASDALYFLLCIFILLSDSTDILLRPFLVKLNFDQLCIPILMCQKVRSPQRIFALQPGFQVSKLVTFIHLQFFNIRPYVD